MTTAIASSTSKASTALKAVRGSATARAVVVTKVPSADPRDTLAWWMREYLTTFATGTASTLQAKAADLEHFYRFFQWAYGDTSARNSVDPTNDSALSDPHVRKWNRETSNAYLQHLDKEISTKPHGRKKAGDARWAASAKNRKIDHLRTFAKWLAGQVPAVIAGNPMHGIQRYDTPSLKAHRIDARTLLRLETAARDLAVTEVRRDTLRIDIHERITRKDARPTRDYALYQLLLGSGLRIQAVANLNIEQCHLDGHIKKLLAVKERGRQEREVVISNDAATALKDYLTTERIADATEWNGSRALFLSVPHQAKKKNDSLHGRMSTRAMAYIVKKIGTNALGVTEGKAIHPHLFRHHMGFLMNERGGITATQKQLGHRNLTYSAVYAQRTDDEMANYLNS
jgi:site-specific recombinase XerD